MKEVELILRITTQQSGEVREDIWSFGEMPPAQADFFYRTFKRRVAKHWWKDSLFAPIGVKKERA